MPHYTPPLRDMQFVLHELFNVVDQLKTLPRHADIDAQHDRTPCSRRAASSPPRCWPR